MRGLRVTANIPWIHLLLYYLVDGGADIIDQKLKALLLQTFRTTVTWSFKL